MSQQDVDTMVTAMTSMRTQMEQLPSHLRPVAGMQIGQMFFSGMQQRVDDYFDSPPDQRQAMLDLNQYLPPTASASWVAIGSSPDLNFILLSPGPETRKRGSGGPVHQVGSLRPLPQVRCDRIQAAEEH